MGTRFGIELSPVACRFVELEGPDLVPGRTPATRVQSYSILPPSGPETDQWFATMGRKSVAIVVWGVRSDHRQVTVSNGSYEKMRTEALASVRAAGVDTRGMLADITPASTAIKGADRQPVVLALASADDVSRAVRPLVEARARIRSIITPADALLGLARSRQAFAVPGGIEAYVALDATVTCVALIRDGSLLGARELAWGYEDGIGTPAPRDSESLARREDLADRLVDELTEFLTALGEEGQAVAQLSVCGGLSNLRTMTVPLMERLDVEVEALDSLFGVDADHLPEPADDFRERAAELRLAWSAAADWRGPINLMRHRRRRERRLVLARAAVIAGVAAGLGGGWAIEQSRWWQSTTPGPIARRTPAATPPAPVRVNPPARTEAPAVAATKPPAAPAVPARTPPPVAPVQPQAPLVATRPPASSPAVNAPPLVARASIPAPPPTARVGVPVAAAPPARVTAPPAVVPDRPASVEPVTRSSPAAAAPKPTVVVPPARPTPVGTAEKPAAIVPVTRPAPGVPAPAPAVPARQIPVTPAGPTSEASARIPAPVTPARQPPLATPPPFAAPAVRLSAPRDEPARTPPPVAAPPPARRPADPPLVPFDAVLGTILYSADRKLAIVNGQIVGPGDEVNGARIEDITPTMVLLRDVQGRLRSLALGAVGRTPAR